MSDPENERSRTPGLRVDDISYVGEQVWCYGTYNGITESLVYSSKGAKSKYDRFGIHREVPLSASTLNTQILFGYTTNGIPGQNVRFSTALSDIAVRNEHVFVPFGANVFEPVAYVPWTAIVRGINPRHASLITPGRKVAQRLVPVGVERQVAGRKLRFDKLGNLLAVTVDANVNAVVEVTPDGDELVGVLPVMVRAQFPDPTVITRNAPQEMQQIIGEYSDEQLRDKREAAEFFSRLRDQTAHAGFSLSVREAL